MQRSEIREFEVSGKGSCVSSPDCGPRAFIRATLAVRQTKVWRPGWSRSGYGLPEGRSREGGFFGLLFLHGQEK